MRRHARHVFTVLAALSLLLCVAAGVLWVRSYWVADSAVYTQPTGAVVTLGSRSGYFTVWRWVPPDGPARKVKRLGWAYVHSPADPKHLTGYLGSPSSRRFLGAAYFDFTHNVAHFNGVRERMVLVPYWMLTAALGAWPLVRLLSLKRRRRAARAAAGLCTECGYDLRASAGLCPECGTPANGRQWAADGGGGK